MRRNARSELLVSTLSPRKMTARAMVHTVAETCFDVLSRLFAADIDKDLLRQGAAKTPTERIVWLEEMQAFADDAKKARKDAAARPIDPAR